MITKLLDSEFFEGLDNSSSTKSSDRVTLSADRLGDISCLLIRRISLQALGKDYIGYLEL